MSESITIFIKTDVSFDSLAKRIESIVDINLKFIEYKDPFPNAKGLYVSTVEKKAFISLIVACDFENDGDMNFENFNFYLSIEAFKERNNIDNIQFRDSISQFIFEKLKSTNDYDLLMTFDLQRKLNEYQKLGFI